jgi:hypothetical protein
MVQHFAASANARLAKMRPRDCTRHPHAAVAAVVRLR